MIVLASRSQVRSKLLTAAGVAHQRAPADIDEAAVVEAWCACEREDRCDWPELALRLARLKAEAVSAPPSASVVAADQLLVFQGRVLQKPTSLEDARARLRAFSGTRHDLIGGAVVRRGGREIAALADVVTVEFNHLGLDDIDRYLDAAGTDILATVGGYEIEGLGARLIAGIEGDVFAALGLPIFRLLAVLRPPYPE